MFSILTPNQATGTPIILIMIINEKYLSEIIATLFVHEIEQESFRSKGHFCFCLWIHHLLRSCESVASQQIHTIMQYLNRPMELDRVRVTLSSSMAAGSNRGLNLNLN